MANSFARVACVLLSVCLVFVSNSVSIVPRPPVGDPSEPQAISWTPCMVVRCGAGTKCVESNGRASCRPTGRPNYQSPPIIATDPANCSRACTKILLPVCSSSGKTYSNECLYKVAVCQGPERDSNLVPMANCQEPRDQDDDEQPTREVRLQNCHLRECPVDKQRPVCGSDGVTYPDSCELEMSSCLGVKVKQVGEGACKQHNC